MRGSLVQWGEEKFGRCLPKYLQDLQKSDTDGARLLNKHVTQAGKHQTQSLRCDRFHLKISIYIERPSASQLLSLICRFDRQRITKSFLNYRYQKSDEIKSRFWRRHLHFLHLFPNWDASALYKVMAGAKGRDRKMEGKVYCNNRRGIPIEPIWELDKMPKVVSTCLKKRSSISRPTRNTCRGGLWSFSMLLGMRMTKEINESIVELMLSTKQNVISLILENIWLIQTEKYHVFHENWSDWVKYLSCSSSVSLIHNHAILIRYDSRRQ